MRFDRPPAEAALFFTELSFSTRSDDLQLVRGPIGVKFDTLLVDVDLQLNSQQNNDT